MSLSDSGLGAVQTPHAPPAAEAIPEAAATTAATLPFAVDTGGLGLGALPYASRRIPVVAARGVVATSQSLAAQAGLHMLRQGGSAVDAALATAIALTVVEPTSNGIGSDAFALVWDGGRLHGFNGSGRAPAAHAPDLFWSRGLSEMPAHGWLTVTVPGTPAAWRDLHARFGRLPFPALFQPAIEYAEHGYSVSPVTASGWAAAAQTYAAEAIGPEYRGWFDTFAPHGRA
ncbi:MAG: gamma-glutamyltransferase, partial [Dehalococcoidia bacterium]